MTKNKEVGEGKNRSRLNNSQIGEREKRSKMKTMTMTTTIRRLWMFLSFHCQPSRVYCEPEQCDWKKEKRKKKKKKKRIRKWIRYKTNIDNSWRKSVFHAISLSVGKKARRKEQEQNQKYKRVRKLSWRGRGKGREKEKKE